MQSKKRIEWKLYVFIALHGLWMFFIVFPSLLSATSLSSKYDVTFGGFVKYDFGWSSQSSSADPLGAYRSSTVNRAVFGDEFSNTFSSGGETRFNFLVKGPDLWGAKTSAFIEGDFRGVTTGNAYGGFQLRHAFMKLQWPGKSELMIGQNWQQWGMPYYGAWIGANDFATYNRGVRQPQMAFRYFFTEEINAMFGIISATDAYGATRQQDSYSRSNWPGLMGEIAYHTYRCGKIGPHNTKFALGGYMGKDKVVYVDPTNVSNFNDDTINAWQAAFRYSIPIVPEKRSNKTMTVLLNGNFFIGQDSGGAGNLLGQGTDSGTYLYSNGPFRRVASASYFGLFSQVSWWVTSNLCVNGMYGYVKQNYSSGARAGLRDSGNMQQSYAANILWDANRAVRFGLQWMRVFTSYNGINPGVGTGLGMAERTGTMDQYRFAAWYFF